MALGTCAAYGGIPAMRNNPTGAMGLRDYLGAGWTSRLGIPIVNLPGCPVAPDNITETLLHLALQLGGMTAMIDLDEQGRPRWLFDRTVHEGCDRAGLAEQGKFADSLRRRRWLSGQAGVHGARREVQRARPRLGQRRSAAARTSGASASAARAPASRTVSCPSWSPRGSACWPRAERASPTARSSGICAQRKMQRTYEREPAWRRPGAELKTGYERRW